MIKPGNRSLLFFFGLILLGGIAVAVIFRQQLLAPVAKRLVIRSVAAELGMEISVDKVTGSYLRDLRITGIRTVKPSAEGMLVSIGAESLAARYSLPLLLHGVDAFLGGLSLEIEGARVELDISREWYTTGGETVSPTSTLVLPQTRAHNADIALRGRNWFLSLSGTDLTVAAFDARRGGIPLTAHANGSAIELPHMRRQSPELGARGLLTRDSIEIDGLEINGERAIEASRFDYAPGEPVRGKVSFSAFAGSGRIEAVFAEDSTELGWDLREIDLAKVIDLLSPEFPSVSGQLTGSGSLAGNFADPTSLNGSFALVATNGAIRKQLYRRFALKGAATDGTLRLDSLETVLGENSLSASDVSSPMAPWLSGDLENALRNTRGYFSARLQNLPALLAMAGVEMPPGFPPKVPHRLVLAGRASAGGITLESGSFSGGGGTVALGRFAATWPDGGPLLEGLRLSVGLKADLPDLGRTAALFGMEDLEGKLLAKVDIEGPWKNLRGTIELHGRDLRYRKTGADRLLLVARSEPDGWRIANLEVDRGEDRLAGSGVVTLAPLRFKKTTLELKIRDVQPYLDWLPVGDIPPAHGGLEADLDFSGTLMDPEGSFRTMITGADIDGVAVSRAELSGTMTGATVKIAALQVQTPNGRVELAGSFRHRSWGPPVTGTVDRLVLAREALSLKLLTSVSFTVAGPRSWTLQEATLQGEGGTLHLGGEVSPATGCHFTFRLGGVRSEPWRVLYPDLPLEFSGLDLEGTVTGKLVAPEVALTGKVAELRASDAYAPLTGQVDLHFSSRGIALKAFSLATKTGERIVMNGTIPYDPYGRRFLPEPLAVKGLFAVPDLEVFSAFLPEEFRLSGSLNGNLDISGSGEHPEAAIDLHAGKVRLPTAVRLRPPGPVSVDAVVTMKDNDLRVETFTAHGDNLNLTISGSWRRAGNLLSRKTTSGLPGSLDFRGALSLTDLGWLAREVPAIRRVGGRVDGTMVVSGEAAAPEITADLSLSDGEFRAESAVPPLRDLQAHVVVAQYRATIERFTGTIGGAPFTVTGAVVLPEGGGSPEADLRVRGSNILLYRSEGLGVRGDADITVRGPYTAPAFAGTVAITDGRLSRNIDWLAELRNLGRIKALTTTGSGKMGNTIGFSFRNPPLKDATFDLRLTSRNPFKIKSNVARGELRPDLRLEGTGEVPLLTGVIYIDPSRVMLPGGRLSIDSGLIRFSENSPGRPQLEINGSSRILGYDINLTVEGYYDEPTISLSSVPPLPQDALLLLLLTGKMPPGATDQAGGWQGGMKVALYVGKGVLEDWFGGSGLDAEESVLERFDVVVGRGISRQGNETIGAQYRLADSVIRDGDQLYLVAERDIYDEFNAGLRIVFRFK